MPRRDDSVPMRHMLDHSREAAAMVTGRTRQDLDTDRMLQLAVCHLIEIVGEAASRVTLPARDRCPEIPRRKFPCSSRRWSGRCRDT